MNNEMMVFLSGILFAIACALALLCFGYLLFLAFAANDAKEQNKEENDDKKKKMISNEYN